ncbi:hypothetical protein [Paraflavitalea pollutisoli]|uniref:hypothetical protein n=1 Tax=Paraflavitalea pollutisoli TaxID=3034143 RepID=UPI0023EE1517|nr:hypothetical protein [Paraflavitalea sp. H1-2-19X]
MKNTLPSFSALASILLLLSCQGPAAQDNHPIDLSDQKIELSVDGLAKTTDPAPILTASFEDAHLLLGYVS